MILFTFLSLIGYSDALGNAGVTPTEGPTVNPFATPPGVVPTFAPDVATVVPYEKYNFTQVPTAAPLVPNVSPQGVEAAPVVSAGPATPLSAAEANGYKGEITNPSTYATQNTSQGINGYDINANTNAVTEAGPVEPATTGYSEDTYHPDQHAVLESTEAPVVGMGPGTVNTTTEEALVSSHVSNAHAHTKEDKSWVVEIPSSIQEGQDGTENIKISLIKDPVAAEAQGMREVHPAGNTNKETIKISFRGHHNKHHGHHEQHEVLDEGSENKLHAKEQIKISFINRKNGTVVPITEDNAGVKDIKISFVTKGNRTIAQEFPATEPAPSDQNEVVVSPFADQKFENSSNNRNISVSFVGDKILQEIPSAQEPTFLPENGKNKILALSPERTVRY